MKTWRSYVLLTLFSLCGQYSIGQTRFLDATYFSTVKTDTAQKFGSNFNYLGVSQNLFLDIYQPVGDTASLRPLIIWIHGGGYTSGTRTDGHMQLWCNEFARRGYVAVSMDYRLGISGDQNGKLKAIYRSVQDAKAAIRFFRRYAAFYKIDVNKVVLAGASVGGFAAVHTAYWDSDELPSAIDTVALGDLEGDSGNPGYPSAPNAVVNFWGAIKDSTWIDAGEPMIVSCAGDEDSVVYPGAHTWFHGDEFGSIVIDRVARSKNISDSLRMFTGAKHTLAGGSGAEQLARWDTATTVASKFLYCNLIANCNPIGIANKPVENSTHYSIYPNPANSQITIRCENSLLGSEFRITDITGRLVHQGKINAVTTTVSIASFVPGIYFIQTGDLSNITRLLKY